MRRMLDPKEVGGGESIHLYSITIDNRKGYNFTYIAASTNNYNIEDNGLSIGYLASNKTYADLCKTGKKYAASGYWLRNNNLVEVYQLKIRDPYTYDIYIFDNTSKTTTIINAKSGDIWMTIFQII